MLKYISLCSGLILSVLAQAQTKTPTQNIVRPKLVVGVVVDQMRWDYLYRFHDIYANDGGFKRLLNNGFSCDNTFIPYIPTVTAAGHSSIYTGSVPAVNGIVGNNWIDVASGENIYCTDDSTVQTIGSETVAVGKMSPKNLWTTTIGDELRFATNYKSKVVGVSFKDRASILPAGHLANGAYWFDSQTGRFITSSYYQNTLPEWVVNFNNRDIVDSLYRQNWTLSFAPSVYANHVGADSSAFEQLHLNGSKTTFPYELSQFVGKDYSQIVKTPWGNTITTEMAKAAIAGEQLGKHENTDMLTVSYSSPDYVGHLTGINSWEQLDDYIKLDKEIGHLLSYLDQQVGKGNYLLFLTADHGVAPVPAENLAHKLPGGIIEVAALAKDMNRQLKQKYGFSDIIIWMENNQVYLNNAILKNAENINKDDLYRWVINYLKAQSGILTAFAFDKTKETLLPEGLKMRVENGYNSQRCGQIQFIMKPGYIDSEKGSVATMHSAWYAYDTHIPLVFYGWNIKKGSSSIEHYMTDIAPTVTNMLHIQMPTGNVGHVIGELK